MTKIPKDPKIKPIVLDTKHNIIGFLILIGAIISILFKWKDFQELFFPKYVFLNWQFFCLMIITTSLIIWFIMNDLWKKEFDAHELTKADRDNFMEELKVSENERLTDVITGIPNSRSLQKDIQEYFSSRSSKKMQFILIDLKNFRAINKKFGYTKTNKLLRLISQSIYRKMRRNEDMYKYFDGKNPKPRDESIYRVYPGGDEFAFVIQGDQSDAIGFCNRLVDQFNILSRKSSDMLGDEIKLSFYCAIVEMDSRDSVEDILKKSEDCYQIAKEGHENFTLCWHPINLEETLSINQFKKNNYDRARKLFEVLTLNEVE